MRERNRERVTKRAIEVKRRKMDTYIKMVKQVEIDRQRKKITKTWTEKVEIKKQIMIIVY